MNAKGSERAKYLLGSVLFLSLLLGGGTESGLYTDSLIEIFATIAAAIVLSAPSEHNVDRRAAWMLAAVLSLVLIQVIPIPETWLNRLRPERLRDVLDYGDPNRVGFISLGVGRTLESLTYLGATIGFFFAVQKLRPDQVVALLPFFFMGVICNILAGAIQYSLVDNISIEGFLPYTIRAGLFANVNHFSTLLFVTIPFVVFYGLFRGYLISGSFGLLSILLLLLAAGSRAGILIGLAVTLISVFFMSSRSRLSRFSILLVFIVMSIYAVGAWTKLESEALDPEFGRAEFARTTIEGIKENWLLGIGFGNFSKAYQIYERESMIFRQYVNHAHNGYLELVFEGGILAAVLIMVYLSLLVWVFLRKDNTALQKSAFLSITFILVHSAVDYPLRTIALALIFSYLNAVLFHSGFKKQVAANVQLMEVDHNGQMLLVPFDGGLEMEVVHKSPTLKAMRSHY